MAPGIRASPAPVASSSHRDARGGSRAGGRARAARIPRAARPADDGQHARNGDDGPVGGGADERVEPAPSVSSATLAAMCASASLIFGAAHVIDARPALAVGTTTTTDSRPSLADRDRRTASRMVDAFDALSREDKVRVVERLMFETESAMMERDDGGPGPRGRGEGGSGRNPGAGDVDDEDEKPYDDDDDDDDEARYAAAAARRRALLEPLAASPSSSLSSSVDALKEMDERDGWSKSNDDVPGSNPGWGALKEPLKEPLKEHLDRLRGAGGDDGATTAPSSYTGGVFQNLFQWFREEGPVLTDLLNDPNARYRAGSLVLVAALALGTLTESRGVSERDGDVEGASPVPADASKKINASNPGDADARPETDDDDAEDETGEEKTTTTTTTRKKSSSPARAGADGVLWSRRDDVDAGLGGAPPPPAASASGGGVLWTRAEDDGVDAAPRREGRRRQGRRAPRLERSDDDEGDRGDRGELVEERERRGSFARAPSGSAPASPPPVIGPVEDENMEGFRLSGRGGSQR